MNEHPTVGVYDDYDEDPGKCPYCNKSWVLVRPGKSQPNCGCQADTETVRWMLEEKTPFDKDDKQYLSEFINAQRMRHDKLSEEFAALYELYTKLLEDMQEAAKSALADSTRRKD